MVAPQLGDGVVPVGVGLRGEALGLLVAVGEEDVAAGSDQRLLRVRDDGMDQETKEKAFSLFFSSKGAEGTGLGLFIAHKITKSHGGTIDIQSDLGKGTRFIVKLPRNRQTTEGINERLDN